MPNMASIILVFKVQSHYLSLCLIVAHKFSIGFKSVSCQAILQLLQLKLGTVTILIVPVPGNNDARQASVNEPQNIFLSGCFTSWMCAVLTGLRNSYCCLVGDLRLS